MNSRYDVIIAGARCAGASTAMLLARSGLRVLAADPDPPGKDTLSTHALMRGGVLQLHRWGVLGGVQAAGTPPIRTTTFHYGDEAIEIAIKPRDGIDALYAPRRPLLDTLLADSARGWGAEIAYGTSVVDLIRDRDGRVTGAILQGSEGARRAVHADLVVGADGMRSRIARLAEAEVVLSGRHAGAVIYGYFQGLEAGGFHWHYRPGVSVGVIPTNEGRTCVFAGMPRGRYHDRLPRDLEALHRQVVLETAPGLARALDGAVRDGNLYAFPGAPGFLRRGWGPGWTLVGDAGFFRDPITAHGITDALRDAELLARAAARGTDHALAEYETARDAMARGMLELSDRVASFEWDLEEAKILHLDLSRQMNAEVALLRGLGPVPEAAGSFVKGAACPTSLPMAAAVRSSI
jgi:2-polyprenyl-6-methoxyphenol hydroxylase-like FAD-dependent oxidoreductase